MKQNVFKAVISQTFPRNVDIIVWNKAVQPQNYACKISSNSVDWLGSSWQPKQNRVPTSKRNTNTKNTTNRSYFKLNLCVNTYIYSCKGTLFIGGAFFELFFISSIWSIFGNVYPIMTLINFLCSF